MKQLVCLTVIFLCVNMAMAQEKPVLPKPAFGIKAGTNLSNNKGGFGSSLGALFEDPQLKLGPVFGLMVNVPLTSHIHFQPEILYSGEGSLQSGQIGASNTFVNVFKVTQNYLNIPLMLQYRTNSGLFFEAGPQIGFLLNSELVNKFPGTGGAATTDLKDVMKSGVFGLAGGLGFQFPGGFGLGARYVAGLSNPYDGNVAQVDLKSSTIQLTAHFMFMRK